MSRFVRIDDIATDGRTRYFRDLLPDDLTVEKGCRLIGAVDDNGIPEGAVAFRVKDNAVDILHVEVYEELRRRGIATSIIKTLLRYLSLTGLPFVVQAVYSGENYDYDRIADSFFRSLPDFEVISGGDYCIVSPDTLWNESRLKFISLYECSVKSYTELSRAEKNNLDSDLKSHDLSRLFKNGRGEMIPELSLCHVEDGRCTTCVIFKESELPHTIELSFLMSKPHREDMLAGVLNEVKKRLSESYKDYNISFSLVNKESKLIAGRFISRDMDSCKILRAVSFGEV